MTTSSPKSEEADPHANKAQEQAETFDNGVDFIIFAVIGLAVCLVLLLLGFVVLFIKYLSLREKNRALQLNYCGNGMTEISTNTNSM